MQFQHIFINICVFFYTIIAFWHLSQLFTVVGANIQICGDDRHTCLQFEACVASSTPQTALTPHTLFAATGSLTWHFRGNTHLHIPGTIEPILSAVAEADFVAPAYPQSFNHHTIVNVTIPQGVWVQLCEPNFANYTRTAVPACVQYSVTTLACEDQAGCILVAPSPRYQLLRLSFLSEWGCFDATDLTGEQSLSHAHTPNQIVTPLPCSTPFSRIVTEGVARCVHACQFVLLGDNTIIEAYDNISPNCPTDHAHAALSTQCQALPAAERLYACSPCSPQPGSSVVPYASRGDQSQCAYEPCPAGTYNSDSTSCQTCPVNKISGSGAALCILCTPGETSDAGHQSCVPCFTNYDPATPASCSVGFELSIDAARVLAFYAEAQDLSPTERDALMYHACTQAFACLPCAPGTRRSADHAACESCPLGQFQPNYGSTACYHCHATESTLATGSVSNDQCLCIAGFEAETSLADFDQF